MPDLSRPDAELLCREKYFGFGFHEVLTQAQFYLTAQLDSEQVRYISHTSYV